MEGVFEEKVLAEEEEDDDPPPPTAAEVAVFSDDPSLDDMMGANGA